jgi:hypothetical protein
MNTISIRTSRWLAIPVTTLLALTACVGAPTGDLPEGSGSPGSEAGEVSATNGDFPDPTPENTGATEAPQGGDAGGVSVSLPGLPIGGNASVDPVDPTWRCAIVNWTGTAEPPPHEVNLTLTRLHVEPPGDYEVIDGGCNDLGPCLDRVNVISGENGRCAVGVRQVTFSANGEGALSVTAGSVACSPQDAAICAQFLAELDRINLAQSIEWSDALTEPPESDTSSDSDGSSGSDASPESDRSPQMDTGGTGEEDGSISSP